MLMLNASAQLYSSGNNVIAGNSVGIGIAAPLAKLHVYQNSNSVVEHVRMQNASSTGAGKFMIYNDNPSNYFTFTKYGSAYAGGYTGISGLFPYANLLAFGNNGGGILLSNAGNIGLNTVTGGVSTLKFLLIMPLAKLGLVAMRHPERKYISTHPQPMTPFVLPMQLQGIQLLMVSSLPIQVQLLLSSIWKTAI